MPDQIQSTFRKIHPSLVKIAAKLENEVRESLGELSHIDRISFRAKSEASFLKKARKVGTDGRAKYSHPFDELEDLVGGRVITFFVSDVEPTLLKLDKLFRRVEGAHKAPARDEEFGYESIHRVYHIPSAIRPRSTQNLPRTFEMQVRTIFMHAYAEPQHDIAYKGSADLPHEVRRELAWIAASAWGADQAYDRVRSWSLGQGADHVRTVQQGR